MNLLHKTTRFVLPILVLGSSVSAYSAEAPQSLTVGTGTAKFGILLQSWGYDDTTAATTKFNFRMRRAEIKFAGSLTESARWFVMADAAKTLSATGDNKVLQDLGVAFLVAPSLEVVLGQVKIPTTAEGLDSSGELLFPERAYVVRNFGDRREAGALLTWKESIWRVNAMISNGQRSNIDDTNNNKDVSVRAEAMPAEGMKFGVFTTAGDYSYGTKSRFGASARFTLGDLLVKGEGVVARDNGIGSHGWVIDSAYSLGERFQPAARWETLNSAGLNPHAGTLGLNYYVVKQGTKIQAAYTFLRDMTGTSGTYVPAAGIRGSLFIVSFQAAI